MAKGWNRKPRRRKQLEGTDRKDRRNPKAPELLPPGKVPPPPKDWALTGRLHPEERTRRKRLREVWFELAPQVEAIRVYSDNHATAFRLLVEMVTEARYPAPGEAPTARVRMKQAAASALREFGLTPASQDRVSANPAALAPPEPAGAAPAADDDEVPLFGPGLKVVEGGGGG